MSRWYANRRSELRSFAVMIIAATATRIKIPSRAIINAAPASCRDECVMRILVGGPRHPGGLLEHEVPRRDLKRPAQVEVPVGVPAGAAAGPNREGRAGVEREDN